MAKYILTGFLILAGFCFLASSQQQQLTTKAPVGTSKPVLAISISSADPAYSSETFFKKYKAIGITHIFLGPPGGWAQVEATEGNFDFSKLDAVLDVIKNIGLKVIIKPESYQTPIWIFNKGVNKLKRADGKTVSAVYKNYKDLPCIFDELGQRYKLTYISRLSKHLRSKYSDLVEYITCGELFGGVWQLPPGSALTWTHSPKALSAYRKWIVSRYHMITQVNQQYGKNWKDFTEAQPPDTYYATQYFTDWYNWLSWAMLELYQREAALVRRCGFKVHCIAHTGTNPIDMYVNFMAWERVNLLDAELINYTNGYINYPNGLAIIENFVDDIAAPLFIYLKGKDGFCSPAEIYERSAEKFKQLKEAIEVLY